MGQGYSLTTLSAGSAGIDVPELGDLTYEKSLGDARFMKSIRARQKQGLVVTKVVMKPYASMKLDVYVKALQHERHVLRDIPNALGYHRILETSTNGYLVRQYIHSSLYDRISTRPFLEDIEKKWLSFQLLCAVRDCHARNVYHGDIKAENTLVTSWNWLLLSDFSSSFKPTYLPEDNPADFSFYFDTSGRRTCYLAPERFLEPGSRSDSRGQVNWAMDIFSVGCVIAELFLETPIFTLSQLFKYRKKEYDPEHAYLRRIQDKDIRELVSHMIQVDPESRYSAEEYLNFWRGRSFPEYFYSFLHQYMYLITDPTGGQKPFSAGEENFGESDDRIDRIYYDLDKISYFLGHESLNDTSDKSSNPPKPGSNLYPLHINIPNNVHSVISSPGPTVDDGTLIFLTLVVGSVRSTARASARLRACELLLAFAERVTDEAKLDRIVPYLVVLLSDKSDIVKAAAIRTLTQVLALVTVISPVNAYIFPEYILPRLQPFVPGSTSKPSSLLRATYASSLALLATTASRFMDMMQSLRVDGALPAADPEAESGSVSRSVYQTLFDVARDDLIGQFEAQTKAFLTDNDSAVRRAFLGAVSSLCVFFGSAKASDVILSHLNTYLNDRDWMLKCAFFEAIVGVATYVGGTSLEEFILPLMLQALTDPEEFVVERVLRSISSMADLGLFSRSKSWELIDVVGRFTMHPNIWIREAAAQFLSSSTKYISVADQHSIVTPLIQPYLKVLPADMAELEILDSLKKPLPRLVLDMSYTWATATDKGIFWKQVQQLRTFSFVAENTLPTISARDLGPKALGRIPKNEEDENWIKRLRNAGMKPDDEFKLVALREFIWRVAHRRYKDDSGTSQSRFNSIIPLKDLGITPQTVFFDSGPDLLGLHKRSVSTHTEDGQHHTIVDALLDASTDAPTDRKRPPNARVDKLTKEDGYDSRAGSAPTSLASSPGTIGDANQPSDIEGRRKLTRAASSRGTPTENSPQPTARDSLKAGDHRHAVRHRNSAINLMSRGDATSKAVAETATTSINAFGKMDIPSRDVLSRRSTQSALTTAKEYKKKNPWEIRFQAAHSYKGNDPNVLRLLDTLYLENYPLDRVEFGSERKSIRGRTPIRQSNGQTPGLWRPEGVFVAMMGEHTAAINRVLVAPDHAFFITGSDDGTVKVWDTSRLERNITHRSRQTFKLASGARVTSLCFVEDSHSFISCGSDGSVNVVRVDFISSGAPYGRLQVLRSYALTGTADGEYAVWTEHFKSDSQSILMLATNHSRIIALELRSMTELYTLHNPVQHGPPACFTIGRRAHWLLLGTAHGVLELWDLRFRLHLRSWRFPTPANSDSSAPPAPITRLGLQYVKGSRRPRVVIAGGTGHADISIWDMEKVICREVYRANPTFASPSTSSSSPHPPPPPTINLSQKEIARTFRLLEMDDSQSAQMIARFAASTTTTTTSNTNNTTATPHLPPPAMTIQALALGTHVTPSSTTTDATPPTTTGTGGASTGGGSGSASAETRHHFFLVAAGPDMKVRFWDGGRPDTSSCIVSGGGLDDLTSAAAANANANANASANAGGGGVVQSSRGEFAVLQGTSDPVVVVEKVPSLGGVAANVMGNGGSGGGQNKQGKEGRRGGGGAAAAVKRDGRGSSSSSAAATAAATAKPGTAGSERGGGAAATSLGTQAGGSGAGGAGNKASRSSLISAQQQALLRSHLDTVLDVAVLESPYGMVISVDRGGMVYVFQ